ncbi:hypothetical protein RR48_00656 [Papilio machaon]|uniref:Flexible cuticle protein 12 n=1 Tax=Papilio machaon TaxID=76193 RepID=A0A0N1IQR7_PAPMA|nr:hypothetical protein RR48_00656 [Papilio machaon]
MQWLLFLAGATLALAAPQKDHTRGISITQDEKGGYSFTVNRGKFHYIA